MDSIMQFFGVGFDINMTPFASSLLLAMAIIIMGLAVILRIHDTTMPGQARLRAMMPGQSFTQSQLEKLLARLKPFYQFLIPQHKTERETTKQRLIKAGFNHPESLLIFYFAKTLCTLVMPGILLSINYLANIIPTHRIQLYVFVLAALGMLIPGYYLDHMTTRRKQIVSNSFPEMLDLLVVCTEAGLGLNAALARVSDELRNSHPLLAEELHRVNSEIRSGLDRSVSFRNLYERTGIEDIRTFTGILNQSLKLGSSIADNLRIYAEDLRDKRMQLAEEKAAKIGTTLIFPLVLCIFPSFFVVAVGPAVIKLIAVFAAIR